MTEAHTSADRVLSSLLWELPTSSIAGDVRVIESWVEGADTIRLVYRNGGAPLMGLRRTLEAAVPEDLLVEELALELGEPQSTRGMVPDDQGLLWWTGNPVSDRTYYPGKRKRALFRRRGR
jgi:hypothetical protein